MIKKNFKKTSSVCKVTFTLPKEAFAEAKEVRVLGDFNNWNWEEGVTMKKRKAEYVAEIGLEAGKSYEFRYRTDKAEWENDWAADKYVPSPFTGVNNSVVELPATMTVVQTPVKPAKKATAKKAAPATKKTTAKRTIKKATGKDNLTKIEGIGPKIASLLEEAGIKTFDALAKAKITVLQEVLKNAGPRFKMHTPTTWSEQANLAAKGDWDTLDTLQKELKGGKRK